MQRRFTCQGVFDLLSRNQHVHPERPKAAQVENISHSKAIGRKQTPQGRGGEKTNVRTDWIKMPFKCYGGDHTILYPCVIRRRKKKYSCRFEQPVALAHQGLGI